MARALRRAGVLGINRRNVDYTLRWNDRRLYPRVDDKLETKRLCQAAGIPTARLLAVATRHAELRQLMAEATRHSSFVLKPARGSMGNGIVVIRDRDGDRFLGSGEATFDARALSYHGAGIISGLFALGGQPDAAFVEERLEVHPELERIVTQGVPDVRIVVFRGVPVMAMTRLPTRLSRGRANLHQGALGAGIDLTSGRTIHAISRDTPVSVHPDTGERVVGRPIPDFDRALELAVRATDQTGLGYVGADVVVDARHGALILELNARPGLAIQVANGAGLLPRLKAIEARWRPGSTVDERLELGRWIARESGAR